MRFRDKVIFIHLAFLAVALGVLGFVMIYFNFKQTLNAKMEYCIEENNIVQSNMEYQLLPVLNQTNPDIPSALTTIGDHTAEKLLVEQTILYLFYGNLAVYSNDSEASMHSLPDNPDLPKKLMKTAKLGVKQHMTVHKNGHYYLYICAVNVVNDKNYHLVTRHDITDTYALLQQQIRYYLLLTISVLLVCSLLLYIISTKLTKPLETLNHLTDRIADGDYTIQAKIDTDDEVGMLASKFNAMTISIAKHIEELNLMVKRREQFVADFTHEIKTPMTAIIGYADTLRQRPLTEAQQQMAYQYIYHEGKRLERLSMKLFDLIYLKEHPIVKSEIEIPALIREVTESIQPICDTKHIVVTTVVADGILYGDADLLKTVFINLVDNARKASAPGSEIRIIGQQTESGYQILVEDDGIGMSKDTITHICDEFYMADKSRTRAEGGAGLGMSLASLIIQKHDAALSIHSQLGEGTTFTLDFPG